MAYASPLVNVNRVVFLGASILKRTFFFHRRGSGAFAIKNYIKHATGRDVQVDDLAVSGDALPDITATWEAEKSNYTASSGTLVLVHALGNSISESGAKWDNLTTTEKNDLITSYQGLIDSIEANGNIAIPINTSFRPYSASSLNSESDGTVAGSFLYNENVLKPVLAGLSFPMGDATQPYFDYYTLTRNLYTGITDGIHPDEDLSGMLVAYTAVNLANRINGDDALVISRVEDPSLNQDRIKGTVKIVATDDSSLIDAFLTADGEKLSQSFGEMFDSLNSITSVVAPAGTIGLSDNSVYFNTGNTSQTLSNDLVKRYARFTSGSTATLFTTLSGYEPNQPVSINIAAYRNSTANDRIGEYSTTATFDDSIKIDGSDNSSSSDSEATMNTGTLVGNADGSGELSLYFRAASGSSFAYLNGVEFTPLAATPTVNAGPDLTATNGDTVTLSGATASNFDSLQWTCTSGQSPTFSDATILNPTVTFNEAGTHTLQLTATNTAGSTSDTLTATVEAIPDTTKPVITLLGSASVTITEGDTYADAGATAVDDTDGDITANIVTVNPVDTNTVGTYTITYNVSDAAGNAADEVTRTVNVEAASLVFNVLESTNINYRSSGADIYKQTLKVGKTNTFSVTLTSWLGDDLISTVDVSSDSITVNSFGFDNDSDAIGALITGVSSGRYPLHFSWITESGRSGCMTGYVDVVEC